MTPEQALESTLNFGVSDLLYSMFPVNYKLFSKPGPSADAFPRLLVQPAHCSGRATSARQDPG
jgi:hypothetical protein